ncbi:MAG: type VI secretion system ATPase TssH, partial [Bacteroidaceae bacterium]|nr:type VI secretion system ATPase TssH [Bacteroidaceae bacterium]
LNRIDEIITFKPLAQSEIQKIVELQVEGVKRMLADSGISIYLTQKAFDFLSQVGYDPAFGARPVKRAIQQYLLNELSKLILAEKIDKSKPIEIDADGTKLIFGTVV